MKIVYCFHSLYHHGGVEKILSVKTNYLVDKLGYDVYIITYNQQNKPVFFDFDQRIKIINLELGELEFNSSNFLVRQFQNYNYNKKFIDVFSKLLNDIKPDITISVGGSEFFILNKITDKSIKIAEYHVTIGAFDIINDNLSGLKKFFANLSFGKFKNNIKKYKKFIVLTKGDEKEWGEFSKNVISIPNPQTFKADEVSTLKSKVAIAVGRFEPEKQFDHLIILWKDIIKKHPDWILKIKGSGGQKQYYLDLISENNLKDSVFIEDASSEMYDFYKNASIYLMASTFEGFSLVMLEAIECGLPIVAYNCKYGPSELVEDNITGFLIKFQDKVEYYNSILKLIEDENLRIEMGKKAKIKAQNYQLDIVMNKWDSLFKELKND
ncbi:glycosyltransferase family 4 protein [Empedobacter falsenii]|uniref:glycosyltransferase family 4 protein n=1 Tax=Empedobacter falsenii TaxID=343874 RepID=UPI002577070F|nr:glycosyltransferase family 4 protein [Empedobacter falsenii]MDM1547822.1 glycosyltransferase family 4 protein [Empedobacter falsenii]